MNTTRKYARTLNEAFPHDATYASAVERCDARVNAFSKLIAAVLMAIAAALVVTQWWLI